MLKKFLNLINKLFLNIYKKIFMIKHTDYKCTSLYKTPKVEIPSKKFICTVNIKSNNYLLVTPFYGNADMEVDWGDGNKENFSGTITNASHTYINLGQYTIIIDGKIEYMRVDVMGQNWRDNLISIDQWGDIGLISMEEACYGCLELLSIPNTPLGYPNITTAANMFWGCYMLSSIPADLFKYNTEITDFTGIFGSCGLLSIPSGLFKYNKKVTTFEGIFTGNNNIINIPPGLFDTNTLVTNFNSTFQMLMIITSIPPGLFANNLLATKFNSTFLGCSSLTGPTPTDSTYGELWDRPGANGMYCFMSCTGLSNYLSIPAAWK